MIRKAAHKDLKRIYALEKRCFKRPFKKDQIESFLLNSNMLALVFENGHDLLGSLILYMDGGGVKVVTIVVHPAHRGRGVARSLMLNAEELLRNRGQGRITLEVSSRNEDAVRLYSSLGYRFDGLIENYYSWGDDAYIMVKDL